MNEALLQTAVRAHKAGNLAEAARLYNEVLRANPRHFPALYAMGFLHYQAGQFDEAQRIIGEAVRVNPRSPDAFFTRGCAFQRLNRPTEALICFEHALALKPDLADAQSNRGMTLMALNRNEQALESLDLALALDASNASAWNNRGCVLQNLGRHEESLACFDKAIAQEPRLAEPLINRGTALSELKRFEQAAADMEKALAIDPDQPYARGNLTFFRMRACDWRNFDADRAEIAAELAAGKRAILPFVNVALSQSMADQLQCARILTAYNAPPSPSPLWRGERYRHDKIRIAYVSADFHAHSTVALMAGVFEQHDRNRFETIGISFGRDDKSDMRARVISAFDRFLDLREKSDAEIASIIRQMDADIAVDLKGYTQNHRSGIFALRPAPIQASYLGYPGTMGAPYIDYIVADRTIIPDEHRSFYTESIAYLPDTYQCNDARRPIAEATPSRAEAGLPENGFVFCCFNNNYKIAPEMFDIWMRLLREIPESVLWLLEDNADAMRNLRREAGARGVAAQRLVFAQRVGAADHLARHRSADLFLDTQPYGAHTTASDALWAGLPVLTTAGPTFAARVAASLLHAVGVPELIAGSVDEYETSALRLARDPAALVSLKAKLAANRATHPLFDTARFTRNLEAVYEFMWHGYQRGEPPQSFAVNDTAGPGKTAGQIPDSAIAAYTQGCSLARSGRPHEALAAFEQALLTAPNFVEALTNRGALLVTMKRYEEALQGLDTALAINPAMVEAWNNRGNALSQLGRYNEAVESYDKVLDIRPGLFEALINRGSALLALRRSGDAFANYGQAVRAKPDSSDALNGRANALFELKRFDEAIPDYEQVLMLDPEHEYTAGILAFARLQCCDWHASEINKDKLAAAVREGKRTVNPFQNLALSQFPENQKQCAAIWVRDKYPLKPALWLGERYEHERIRLAYLSGEFRDHAVAQAMAGLFEHHDRTRFEITAISWGPPDQSEMRTRLTGVFDRFVDVEGDNDAQAARILREMEIDVAIDLMGFTGECRPGILAGRPAPAQVNFLGYPGTMGAPYIDYLIADRVVIPESEQPHYSENVVYLPDSYLPIDSTRRSSADVPARHEAGLPETAFVFASFNNSYKFSPELFDIWMRLLQAVEGSVLWLSAGNPAVARNLAREAEARGVESGRLIFAPFLPRSEDHLARLGLADLFLDTLPYNAHATAADALLAGLPLLTCKGSTFAGRVAASLLYSAGLPELVTESSADYEALALKLAREPAMLATAKTKLARNRDTHPLFDTARFTHHIEAAFTAMVERSRRGERPAPFAVTATPSSS